MREGRAVVVAQLVEQSLLTPEVRSLNPVIYKLLYRTFICFCQLYIKVGNKEKESRNGPFKKMIEGCKTVLNGFLKFGWYW